MLRLAQRVNTLRPSPIMEISAQAQELRAKGQSVISLAAGEPDFDTPKEIRDAAIKAISEGVTRYTPAAGFLALREAIAEKTSREMGVSFTPQEVIATVGAKHAIYLAMQCLVEHGDAVLVPMPAWVSYGPIVELAGARIIPLPLYEEDGFRVNVDRWKGMSIPSNVRGMLINSPNNPTGATYTKDDLIRLAGWALQRNLWVMSDEIYQNITYDGVTHTSLASLGPEIRSQVITIGGCSIGCCMTGWRLGWAVAEPTLIAKMSAIQSQCNSHATSFVQWAGITATRLHAGVIAEMVAEFDKRRQYCMGELDKLSNHLTYPRATGAFYFFLNLSTWLSQRHLSDVDFCKTFLLEHHVGLIPGSAFGARNFVRMTYATSMDNLRTAMGELGEFLNRS